MVFFYSHNNVSLLGNIWIYTNITWLITWFVFTFTNAYCFSSTQILYK